jgi:predicted alpha/beta superfamily hydrolase
MSRVLFAILFFTTLFVVAPSIVYAQQAVGKPSTQVDENAPKSVRKRQMQLNKEKERKEKEKKKKEEDLRKRHMKMQSKETRKRMKNTKRKSDNLNDNKRDNWLIRIFKK